MEERVGGHGTVGCCHPVGSSDQEPRSHVFSKPRQGPEPKRAWLHRATAPGRGSLWLLEGREEAVHGDLTTQSREEEAARPPEVRPDKEAPGLLKSQPLPSTPVRKPGRPGDPALLCVASSSSRCPKAGPEGLSREQQSLLGPTQLASPLSPVAQPGRGPAGERLGMESWDFLRDPRLPAV